nr:hypothetical protein GCM10020092_080770 [Actinoplanes digitatis]
MVGRAANVLRELGLQPEQRIVMFMADTPEFVTVYLAAMRIGAVPVPVSTMIRADGLTEILHDSRARMLAVTAGFTDVATAAAPKAPDLRAVLTSGGPGPEPKRDGAVRWYDWDELTMAADPDATCYPTTPDSLGVLAVHLRHDRQGEGRHAPACLRRGGVFHLCHAGARHPAGRPVPVRGQGVLRLWTG